MIVHTVESLLSESTERLVLDTNVWLDWFVFEQSADSEVMQLRQYIERQQSHPTAHHSCAIVMDAPMWEEWVDVLGREQFSVPAERQAVICAKMQNIVTMVETPSAPLPHIRCTDRDDQIFIDTALAYKASWLISKDKHLLALSSRARAWGIAVGTPEQWCAAQQNTDAPKPVMPHLNNRNTALNAADKNNMERA